MPGDWMSASMTPTRRPSAARQAARFAVVLDLPVPPRNECTDTMVATDAPLPPPERPCFLGGGLYPMGPGARRWGRAESAS